MPAVQNFRTAFNGFNKTDVVHYLEYLQTKHTAEINQLTSEAEYLRNKLETNASSQEQAEQILSLEQERDALRAELEELKQQLAEQPAMPTTGDELEAYRRAERAERLANERAELVYHQTNSVLAEAAARISQASAEITPMAQQVLAQLNQLQDCVNSGKQSLQEAASIVSALRPDNI